MYASRVLRIAAAKGGHFLVPPRTSMDIFASAANAVVSLFKSEDKRKIFASFVDNGVIVPEVLGQANLGYLRILALHDELESPTLKEHGFNVDEFLEGVKPALEQFHDVQAHLHNSMHEIANNKEESDDAESRKEDEERVGKEKAALAAFLGARVGDEQRLGRVVRYSWKKEAEKDPDSYAARLMSMTATSTFFEGLQMGCKTSYFLDPLVTFEKGSAEIHNVALLSARGVVMHPDEKVEEKEAEEIVTDAKEETKLPVAAQVEVLYDVEQTLVPRSQDDDDDDKMETKKVTRTSVLVGVFEGWLNGNPDGNSELRWKMAEVRPAWEFPLLNNRSYGKVEL